ncbi:copper-binding protein [Malikia granosa]|uniref:Copper-binding protein n=1 Tax=Malikia granosa TaxID=263067 RepID=A0A2S9K1T0_9BURK|nr:copper-binding protein [Malikia granosa]PRD64404.1 copper-binding protein [Malikia granosa]
MNHQHKFLTISALALGLIWPMSGFAQANNQPPGAVEARPATALSEGEIRRLDPETGKLTIRHGEIRNLDMPPMTMVFTAKDKAMLAGLKVGDRIRFAASNEGGRYLVTEIQPAQ